MAAIPFEQIQDAHLLEADAEIFLYEFTPSVGTGTVYLTPDNSKDWRGHTYEGIPLAFSGDKKSSTGGASMPTLILGDANVDLLPLKPLVFDQNLDGGTVVRIRILLEDFLNDRLVASYEYYRVKQVGEYSRQKITLELASLGDSLNFSIPFRQFSAPDFPSVLL